MRSQSFQGHPVALEILIVSDHPLSNMVENMPSHTKTPPELVMFEQRAGCVKVVLPKKEMVALSIAMQRRSVPRDRAPEQRPLPIKVFMDQHNRHHLLIIG